MKNVLLLFMMLISLTYFSQTFTTNSQRFPINNKTDSIKSILEQPKWMSNSPGIELQMASKEYYGGFGMVALGSVMGFFGMTQNDEVVSVVGIGVAFVGSILMLDSHRHINRAGIIMDSRGIGIKVNL